MDFSEIRPQLNNNYIALLNSIRRLCENFIVDEFNKHALKLITAYYSGVEIENMSIDKGMIIFGQKGTGKTIIMKALQKSLIKTEYKFSIYNAIDISESFSTGSDETSKYFDLKFPESKKNMFIDDLGAERHTVKNFGNEIKPLTYIISKRYELFTRYGIKTHFTTNLNFDEIESVYDDRIADRIKEMCNVIEIKGSSRRK